MKISTTHRQAFVPPVQDPAGLLQLRLKRRTGVRKMNLPNFSLFSLETSLTEIPLHGMGEFYALQSHNDFDINTCRLEKQSSIRSLPADRHSPWISPLARPDSVHDHQYRQSSARISPDSDSDGSGHEGGWRNSPVIPTKPMMETMALIPNTAYFGPPPMIPSIQYHPPINTGSPAPHQSPYLYASPHLDSPSYVPSWSPPPLIARPFSRVYSGAYASPSPF